MTEKGKEDFMEEQCCLICEKTLKETTTLVVHSKNLIRPDIKAKHVITEIVLEERRKIKRRHPFCRKSYTSSVCCMQPERKMHLYTFCAYSFT